MEGDKELLESLIIFFGKINVYSCLRSVYAGKALVSYVIGKSK